jgi:uncharacterized membrane protein
MKYKVSFKEVQMWVYDYEIEADSAELAHDIAKQKFEDGEQSDDNYVDDSRVLHSEVIKL